MLKDNLKGLWIPIEILTDDAISDKEKLIYSLLLFFSTQNGSCTITNNLISNLFAISKTQVSKLISSLVSTYKNLGEQYILSSVLHLDEETPHMHLVFIPVVHTKNKQGQDIDKIACSEFGKAKDSYRQLQNAFYDYMTSNGFDLDRGTTSDRVHIPVNTFKEITDYNNINTPALLKATPIKVTDISELPKLTLNRDKLINENIINKLKT